MPSIVIIYHPGNEPSIPKNKNYHIIDWNRLGKSHTRKFLLSKGRYVDITPINDQVEINTLKNLKENKGCLTFWGEWEPQSIALKISASGKCNCPCKCNKIPKYLHLPFLDTNITNYPSGLQSTDPFVFGDSFIYFFCNQGKYINKKDKDKDKNQEKDITNLSPLSLVLFGSGFHEAFHLDTLIVIPNNEITPESIFHYNARYLRSSNIFRSRYLRSLNIFCSRYLRSLNVFCSRYLRSLNIFCSRYLRSLNIFCSRYLRSLNLPHSFINASWNPVMNFLNTNIKNTTNSKNKNNNYTLYKGVNFQDRNNYNGIFSFVPVKKYDQNNLANSIFCRPQIVLNHIINLNQRKNQGVQIISKNKYGNDINDEDIVKIWNNIAHQVKNQDLFLGTYFEPPNNISKNSIINCICNK